LLFFYCLLSSSLFAQANRRIVEDDLAKSFKKINYWDQQRYKDTTDVWTDSLQSANDAFGKKLKYFTSKFPETINSLHNLEPLGVKVITSNDGLFRIYSWDTETGGTMHFFDNVFQYKSGNKTNSILNAPKSEGDIGVYYRNVYTFNYNGKNYYLCVFTFIESSRYYGEGIRVYSIEKDRLNENVKLIKTNTGLHERLSYEYDFGSIIDWKVRPEIYFDAASKTINLPLIKSNGEVTHRYITYKFTGQYFERVKN